MTWISGLRLPSHDLLQPFPVFFFMNIKHYFRELTMIIIKKARHFARNRHFFRSPGAAFSHQKARRSPLLARGFLPYSFAAYDLALHSLPLSLSTSVSSFNILTSRTMSSPGSQILGPSQGTRSFVSSRYIYQISYCTLNSLSPKRF